MKENTYSLYVLYDLKTGICISSGCAERSSACAAEIFKRERELHAPGTRRFALRWVDYQNWMDAQFRNLYDESR